MCDLYFRSCTTIGVLCWARFVLPLVVAIPTLFLNLISPLIFYWWFLSPQLFHLGCLRWFNFPPSLCCSVDLTFLASWGVPRWGCLLSCAYFSGKIMLRLRCSLPVAISFHGLHCPRVSYPWLLHPLLNPGVGSLGPTLGFAFWHGGSFHCPTYL